MATPSMHEALARLVGAVGVSAARDEPAHDAAARLPRRPLAHVRERGVQHRGLRGEGRRVGDLGRASRPHRSLPLGPERLSG